MIATILKIEKQKAKDGGFFWYIFFKSLEGKSFRACVYEKYRNYSKWIDIIKNNRVGVVLSDLEIKSGKIIDADSNFIMQCQMSISTAPIAAPIVHEYYRPAGAPPAGSTKPDIAKAITPPDHAVKAIVAPIYCDLCGKIIQKEISCNLKVNIGAVIEENCSGEMDKSADEYINLEIHLTCRNELFDRIGGANDFNRKKIDSDLVEKAKAKAAR